MANAKSGAPFANIGLVTEVHTSAMNDLGAIREDTLGGEYIYLKGLTATAIGTWVTYDELGVTALLTANAIGPVAVAMAAVDANTKYGWYCIRTPENGISAGAAATVVDNKPCYIDGTDGLVDDDVVSGDYVVGAVFRSTTTSSLATVQFNRPFVTDVLG